MKDSHGLQLIFGSVQSAVLLCYREMKANEGMPKQGRGFLNTTTCFGILFSHLFPVPEYRKR